MEGKGPQEEEKPWERDTIVVVLSTTLYLQIPERWGNIQGTKQKVEAK